MYLNLTPVTLDWVSNNFDSNKQVGKTQKQRSSVFNTDCVLSIIQRLHFSQVFKEQLPIIFTVFTFTVCTLCMSVYIYFFILSFNLSLIYNMQM